LFTNFDPSRWERIRHDANLWWAGKLNRPLIQVRLSGYEPNRPQPAIPHVDFESFYDLSITPEQVVDRWDYDLSCTTFMGDGFPQVWPNFGPGVLAAFLGASLSNGEHTVWYSYSQMQEDIHKLRLTYSPDNIWYKRIRDITIAACKHWNGKVQIGATDLGGTLDVLATFRGPEQLVMDLYDNPEEVKRLTWEINQAWWQYYLDFEAILKPYNPGSTSWEGTFSNYRHSIVQCDFAYMIGPQMFEEFVKPELVNAASRLNTCFYHLDGIGQLAHLDSILQIPYIQGIQWVPGVGQPDVSQWPEVYRKIRRAGKLIHIFDFQCELGFELLNVLKDQLGSLDGIVYVIIGDKSQKAQVEVLLDKFGVPQK